MALFIFLPPLAPLALLAWLQFDWAVILLAGLLPTYLLRIPGGIPTNFLELAIIIVTLVGFIQSSVRFRWKKIIPTIPPAMWWLIFIFILAGCLSTFISPHPTTSLGILKGWIFLPLVLGWLVYSVAWTDKTTIIIQIITLSGVVVALLGLSQFGQLPRLRSVYDVPNSLALFLVPLFILVMWPLFSSSRPAVKKLSAGFALIIGLGILGTQSAAALGAVVISLGGGLIIWRPHHHKKYLAIILVMTVVAGSYLAFTGRLTYLLAPLWNPAVTNSISVRRQLWNISEQLIRQHPFTGVGLGTFEPAYQQFLRQRFQDYELHPSGSPPIPEFVFRDPHNWILAFWLNTGLMGLLAFTGLHIFVAKHAFRPPPTVLTQALFLSLVSLFLFGLVDTIYWKNDLAVLQWILLALLWKNTNQNYFGQKPFRGQV